MFVIAVLMVQIFTESNDNLKLGVSLKTRKCKKLVNSTMSSKSYRLDARVPSSSGYPL